MSKDIVLNRYAELLPNYMEGRRRLELAKSVDEVKTFRDKAIALEVYAAQAQDNELEVNARKLRIRAERKAGEMLSKMQTASHNRGNRHTGSLAKFGDQKQLESELAEAKRSANISDWQAHQWKGLANIDEDRFEDMLEDPNSDPSTSALLAADKKAKPRYEMDEDSLWVWGTCRDFHRDKILERNPDVVVNAMSGHMVRDLVIMIPEIIKYLEEIQTKCQTQLNKSGSKSEPLSMSSSPATSSSSIRGSLRTKH